jgi:hypothetical protein|tara:strand:- start:13197 stop:13520 length:324 start_codon:yes stop_codon:yes gene_type:complete
MLDTFLKLLEDDSEKVDVKDLLKDKKDLVLWEKMVDIFDSIEINDVTDGIEKVSLKYNLSHKEEITVLAYIKFLEIMVLKIKLAHEMMEGMQGIEMPSRKDELNMYG